MTDSQRRVPIEEELKETQEDLIRAEKTIKTYKETTKTYEAQIQTFKKKIESLQARKVEPTITEFQSREKIQELNRTVERLTIDNEQLKHVNKELMAHKIELERKNFELIQADMVIQKLKEEKAQLEKSIAALKKEVELGRKEVKPQSLPPKDKESEKKIASLEKQLSQARKTISELQAAKASSKGSTPTSRQDKPDFSVMTSISTESIDFYEGVNLQLQAFQDPYTEYPSSHRRIIKLIQDYLAKLLPKFQLNFLNILTATAESKIEQIDDSILLNDLYS